MLDNGEERVYMRYNNLFLKRIGARVLILFLIVNSLFVLVTESVSASEETSYEIVLNLTFSEPEITQYNSSNITYHNVTIEGLPSICNPGQPVLPMKPLKVLLPQKTSLDSITATYKGNI